MPGKTHELYGWLLDLYPDANGLSLWFLGEDGVRYHLHQSFPVCFYAAGSNEQLRAFWKWLSNQPESPCLSRQERRDLFAGIVPVLAGELRCPGDLQRLFHALRKPSPT
jgi:hypothetical protein